MQEARISTAVCDCGAAAVARAYDTSSRCHGRDSCPPINVLFQATMTRIFKQGQAPGSEGKVHVHVMVKLF